MRKLAALAVCSLSLGVLGGFAPSANAKTMAKKMTSVVCPACQKMGMSMPMTSMKTKANTRAVKVNGKTMYCCSKCNMKTMTTKKMKGKMSSKKM